MRLLPLLLVLAACSHPQEDAPAADMTTGTSDLATTLDLTTPEPPRDLLPPSRWNPAAPPTYTAACKSTRGRALTENAVACEAPLLNSGDIDHQCGFGWTLCLDSPLDPVDCMTVPWGFYASLAVWWQPSLIPPQDAAKGAPDWEKRFIGGYRGLLGCGTAKGATSADPASNNTRYVRLMPCSDGTGSVSSFYCPGNDERQVDLPKVLNSDEHSGVLCCRP